MDILFFILPAIFIIVAIVIIQTPTQSLLNIDSLTGKQIYLRILKQTNNKNNALKSARKFYNGFAYTIIVFNIIYLLLIFVLI